MLLVRTLNPLTDVVGADVKPSGVNVTLVSPRAVNPEAFTSSPTLWVRTPNPRRFVVGAPQTLSASLWVTTSNPHADCAERHEA